MINVIINFIKNLFISEGEKPTKVITQTQKEIQDMPILDTFEEIIDKVIEHEGGYVNDPDDPGGETKYGIAKKSNPDVDIANLTIEEAKKIYWDKYWVPNKVDKVPSQLKYIYYDMCVNMGRSNAVKVLQRAANHKGADISGVYYFKSTGDDGDIFFTTPNQYTEMSDVWSSDRFSHTSDEGKLLIFPSKP